jgi:phage FluMu gp28-like protein
MRARFFLGLDLGKQRDHSAIAVVERLETPQPYLARAVYAGMAVRHVERLALGTPYPAVVERVRWILGAPELAGQCAVAVDATGLGAPVVEMLRGSGLGCEIAAVTITGGERETELAGDAWNVPKRDLITGLQMLVERGELRIAGNLKGVGALVRELVDIRLTAREGGGVRMGADGAGEHDDMAIAVALGCWRAARKVKGPVGEVGRRLW